MVVMQRCRSTAPAKLPLQPCSLPQMAPPYRTRLFPCYVHIEIFPPPIGPCPQVCRHRPPYLSQRTPSSSPLLPSAPPRFQHPQKDVPAHPGPDLELGGAQRRDGKCQHSVLDRRVHAADPAEFPARVRRRAESRVPHHLAARRCVQYHRHGGAGSFADHGGLGYCCRRWEEFVGDCGLD